jgi:hypothetical protein
MDAFVVPKGAQAARFRHAGALPESCKYTLKVNDATSYSKASFNS